MRQSILLTRPSGLVGNHLLNVLKNKPEVTAPDRRHRGDDENVRWVQSDFSDFDISVFNKIKNVNVIIHNAVSLKTPLDPNEKNEMNIMNICSNCTNENSRIE